MVLCNYIVSADILRLAVLAFLFNRHFYLHVLNSVYEHQYVTLIQVIIVTGGQKQRIALARAIIKVSNILYIDVLSCYVVFSLADNKLLTTYTNVCLLFHVWWPKHFFEVFKYPTYNCICHMNKFNELPDWDNIKIVIKSLEISPIYKLTLHVLKCL